VNLDVPGGRTLSTLRVSPFAAADDAGAAVITLLRSLGEDPSRPGLRGTPERVALSLDDLADGRVIGLSKLSAAHFCMMRGIEKQGALTETAFFTGEFRDSAERRTEVLDAVRKDLPGRPDLRVPGLPE
jgi:GTP cyclohydrolase I